MWLHSHQVGAAIQLCHPASEEAPGNQHGREASMSLGFPRIAANTAHRLLQHRCPRAALSQSPSRASSCQRAPQLPSCCPPAACARAGVLACWLHTGARRGTPVKAP